MLNKINKKLLLFFIFLYIPQNVFCEEYSRETPIVKAVRKVSPAVVNISSEYEIKRGENPFSQFGGDSFFDFFFKDFFDPGYNRKYKRSSLGSGVIIDGKRGFILTNAHVISKATNITVILKDERELTAQIIGSDPASDLAVLRISSNKSLPAIEMGNSDDLMIGETVIAIGNPFGFSNTVTTGVISALNRNFRIDDNEFQDFIQTDASINPGNSGGPLLNINGELIGINTAIYAKAQGIGFAIPINKAKRIISDLISHGEVVEPWIGLHVQDIDERLAEYLNISGKRGVIVKKVEEGSPAKQAGVKYGDVVLAIKNKSIRSSSEYNNVIRDYSPGDRLEMQIWRNNKEETIYVKAIDFPISMAKNIAFDLFGIEVQNLSSKYKIYTKEGVVISKLNRYSYLAKIGVRPGDIIRQIDEIKIKDKDDFEKAIAKYRTKESVVILLQRDNRLYNINVKFQYEME
ncbi:MAG: Do family serine endopeptidase [Desulfobacterales bacterium]|nr:Do family serine endopeptidase [Desulfobacterales bacterium]